MAAAHRPSCSVSASDAQERDPSQLLGSLQAELQARRATMQHALFVPLDSSSFTVQARLADDELSHARLAAAALTWVGVCRRLAARQQVTGPGRSRCRKPGLGQRTELVL